MAYFRKRGKTWSFTVTVSCAGEKRRQKSGYGYKTKKTLLSFLDLQELF